jgi:hypothetical protein
MSKPTQPAPPPAENAPPQPPPVECSNEQPVLIHRKIVNSREVEA